IVALSTVALIGSGSIFSTNVTYADKVDELEDQQSDIEEKRSKIKEDLSEAEAEVADVLIEVEELNKEIEKLDEALEKNKEKKKEEIEDFEEEIETLEEKIEERTGILKDRIASYQKSGGNIDYLDVIFGSKDFGDLISRISAVTKITSSDQKLLEEQEEDQA